MFHYIKNIKYFTKYKDCYNTRDNSNTTMKRDTTIKSKEKKSLVSTGDISDIKLQFHKFNL